MNTVQEDDLWTRTIAMRSRARGTKWVSGVTVMQPVERAFIVVRLRASMRTMLQ
jgi:hypothetical protein